MTHAELTAAIARLEKLDAFCIERDFTEWAKLPGYRWLPLDKDGDCEYENESTRRFYACFEYAYKKGMWGAARHINGALCDQVSALQSRLKVAEEALENAQKVLDSRRLIDFVCAGHADLVQTAIAEIRGK